MSEKLLPDPTYYPTPSEAMRAPTERIAYVACLFTGVDANRPDFIAVVDVDQASSSYGKVVGRVELPKPGDELHHFGWNACSSMLCPYGNPTLERRYLIVPGLRSSNIYILDTKPDSKHPRLVKTIPAEKTVSVSGYSRFHTVHCGPDGVYVSGLGSGLGDEGPGGILVLDHYSFSPLGRFEIARGSQYLAYDFWWHLGEDVMITSEWAVPKYFENGPASKHWRRGYMVTDCTFGTLRKENTSRKLP